MRHPPRWSANCGCGEDFLFKGYLDAALDAEAFDAEGWYRTGDLGSVDESGYVRITGRLKDVIIRKGENISAKDVEGVVYSHPDVADVAVIGLPDEARGELVCAVVVLTPGAAEMDVPALAGYLDTRGLMRQKYPERVVVLDALPRNAAGRVAKGELSRLVKPKFRLGKRRINQPGEPGQVLRLARSRP